MADNRYGRPGAAPPTTIFTSPPFRFNFVPCMTLFPNHSFLFNSCSGSHSFISSYFSSLLLWGFRMFVCFWIGLLRLSEQIDRTCVFVGWRLLFEFPQIRSGWMVVGLCNINTTGSNGIIPCPWMIPRGSSQEQGSPIKTSIRWQNSFSQLLVRVLELFICGLLKPFGHVAGMFI